MPDEVCSRLRNGRFSSSRLIIDGLPKPNPRQTGTSPPAFSLETITGFFWGENFFSGVGGQHHDSPASIALGRVRCHVVDRSGGLVNF